MFSIHFSTFMGLGRRLKYFCRDSFLCRPTAISGRKFWKFCQNSPQVASFGGKGVLNIDLSKKKTSKQCLHGSLCDRLLLDRTASHVSIVLKFFSVAHLCFSDPRGSWQWLFSQLNWAMKKRSRWNDISLPLMWCFQCPILGYLRLLVAVLNNYVATDLV